MKDKEETYTVDELQEMWGVTKRRLIKFILEGKLIIGIFSVKFVICNIFCHFKCYFKLFRHL